MLLETTSSRALRKEKIRLKSSTCGCGRSYSVISCLTHAGDIPLWTRCGCSRLSKLFSDRYCCDPTRYSSRLGGLQGSKQGMASATTSQRYSHALINPCPLRSLLNPMESNELNHDHQLNLQLDIETLEYKYSYSSESESSVAESETSTESSQQSWVLPLRARRRLPCSANIHHLRSGPQLQLEFSCPYQDATSAADSHPQSVK
eukprot:IDg18129t1